jgi:phosphonatase-like hydrolase
LDELALVIFDIAGTTVQDHGEVPAAFTAVLAEHGIAITPDRIKQVRGASKRHALRQLVPVGPDQDHVVEELYASFRAHLARRYAAEGVHAIAGTEDVFRLLREQGVGVALNTGFDRETTNLLLVALGWKDGWADAVVCGDDVSQGRPAPYLIFRAMEATGTESVHQVAVVGDTTRDLQAGYHAGVRWNIGVLTGAHDRQTLKRAPHTHLLPSVAELARVWEAV